MQQFCLVSGDPISIPGAGRGGDLDPAEAGAREHHPVRGQLRREERSDHRDGVPQRRRAVRQDRGRGLLTHRSRLHSFCPSDLFGCAISTLRKYCPP